MPFIYVPILQKNRDILELLLDVPTLWCMEELKSIAMFMKQVKWREGFQVLLSSKAIHQQYKRLVLPERFQFIREFLVMPFMVDKIPLDLDDDEIEAQQQQYQQ